MRIIASFVEGLSQLDRVSGSILKETILRPLLAIPFLGVRQREHALELLKQAFDNHRVFVPGPSPSARPPQRSGLAPKGSVFQARAQPTMPTQALGTWPLLPRPGQVYHQAAKAP